MSWFHSADLCLSVCSIDPVGLQKVTFGVGMGLSNTLIALLYCLVC